MASYERCSGITIRGPVQEKILATSLALEQEEVHTEEVLAGPVVGEAPRPIAQEQEEVHPEEVLAGPVVGEAPRPIAQEEEITLVDWFPVLEAGNLHFEGLRHFQGTITRYTTAAVKTRVGQGQSCSHVRLTDGNTCHLLGCLRDVNNHVPTSGGHASATAPSFTMGY
ncbi:uncharacterized protein LOC126235601 [Schistocerca nitens]|uniref:uncharacterized protein LOC126235601 n=1 Tax=Schistocerca nitens TaxID=7011 RepID=UPI0021185B5C|nr:uncharacterized protein LOC126235601 [Schistocerca nitens]